jgi:hypothetical protein
MLLVHPLTPVLLVGPKDGHKTGGAEAIAIQPLSPNCGLRRPTR